ncbi:MAG: hypothetical protein ACKOB3_00515, partial [Holophagaceae bacterium]
MVFQDNLIEGSHDNNIENHILDREQPKTGYDDQQTDSDNDSSTNDIDNNTIRQKTNNRKRPPEMDLWQGHQPNEQIDTHQNTRMLFQNIRGLKTPESTINQSIKDMTAALSYYDISIAAISEHHLPMEDPKIRKQILEAQKGATQRGKLHMQLNASTEIPVNKTRLMGGTGVITCGACTGRLAPKGSGGDKMGRWSFCHYRMQENLLTVISIYKVCKKAAKKKQATQPVATTEEAAANNASRKKQQTHRLGHSAWHQQRRALDLQDRKSENPRDAFHKDLEKFIEQCISKNHDIIIGGDWNDHIEVPRSPILRLCTRFQLIDPWMTFNPQYPNFATYEWGKERIDSVLISQRLLPALLNISYTPVGFLNNTDHRGILLDWKTDVLFGNRIDTSECYAARLVRANDRTTVTRYIEETYDHMFFNNAFERMKSLETAEAITQEHLETLEKLDDLMGEASQIGENRCPKRRSAWFSQKLVRTRLEISYLKYLRNGALCGLDRTISTKAKLRMINSDLEIDSADMLDINTMIEQRIETLKEQKEKAFHLRQQYLHDSDNLPKKQTDPRQRIRKAEVALRTWKTIATMSSGRNSQSIDRLQVPQDWPDPFTPMEQITSLSDPKQATNWKLITDLNQVEYYLLVRNQLHFGQAQGTPFTEEPLKSTIDWGANSKESEEVLDGDYIPPAAFQSLCSEVLQECKRKAEDELVEASTSPEEFKGKMKRWKESTTTSPSGRHLGRYKAMYGKSIYGDNDDETRDFYEKQQALIGFVLGTMNVCIRSGYVLKRWRKVTNLMIFKDTGNYHVHRLRIIHIYEADLNLLMAVKWRQLLQAADRLGLVNVNQYGGRPGREATTLALMEELKIDISYSTRRTLITFDNDAASCYDRIIPSFASLINRKYGMPRQLTQIHGQMLRQAEYRLRTPKGISETSYSHTNELPIYGSGQGSGNSPVLWLLISATLFDVHEKHVKGATFTSPDNTTEVSISISGFVDDTNASLNEWNPQTQGPTDQLLEQLQHDAQTWNDLLFTSGGKLELNKCSFHV